MHDVNKIQGGRRGAIGRCESYYTLTLYPYEDAHT